MGSPGKNWYLLGHQKVSENEHQEFIYALTSFYLQCIWAAKLIIMNLIIRPVQPPAHFHCKTIGKISVLRIRASRARKCRTALLGTRTAPYDVILEDFVAFKHPSYLQPEKQIQTTY